MKELTFLIYTAETFLLTEFTKYQALLKGQGWRINDLPTRTYLCFIY